MWSKADYPLSNLIHGARVNERAFLTVDLREVGAGMTRLQAEGHVARARELGRNALEHSAGMALSAGQAMMRLRLTERLVRLALAAGDLSEARALQDHAQGFARDKGLAASVWVEISLRFAEARIDEAWALAQEAQLGTDQPPTPAIRRVMAQLAIESDEIATAEAMLRSLLDDTPEDVAAFALLFEAVSVRDPAAIVPEALARLEAGQATPAQVLALDAHCRHGDIAPEDLLPVLTRAVALFPDHAGLRRCRDKRAANAEAAPLRGNSPEAQLAEIKARMQARGTFREIAAARLEAMSALTERDLTRPVMAQSHGTNIAHSPMLVGGDVMLRFSGLADTGFSHYIDAMASIAGLNVVYLHDKKRLFYCNGLPELGDTLDATLDSLRRRLAIYGKVRLSTFGSSAGGFGALLYGILLGADRVLALSPPVTTLRDVSHQLNDYRARALLKRLELRLGDGVRDIRQILERHTGPVPRIDLVYGADNKIDHAHATHLADLPGVHLYPLDGVDTHNTNGLLSSLGLMPALMRGDMACLDGMVTR